MQGSDLANRAVGRCEITCSDFSAFRKYQHQDFEHTAALLNRAQEQLDSGMLSKTKFKQLETAAGFRANPHGICSSSSLMKLVVLPDAINYDWIRSALQAGVFTHEVEALLSVTRIRRDDLQTFLANPTWSYPDRSSQKAKQLHRVFDARRVSAEEPDKIRASCSELLGLFGMLRVFFALRCGEMAEFRGPLSSFDAACEVMDLFLLCKRGLVTISQGVPKLKAALSLHLRLHQETYGDAWITPKHHWLCDVPDQILRDGLVLDTLVIERTHLQVKAIAENVQNTIAFERSVLSGIVVTTLRNSNENPNFALLGRTATLPGSAALVADKALVYGLEMQVGEIIVKGRSLGAIVAFVAEDGDLSVLAHPLDTVSEVCKSVTICRQALRFEVWPATQIHHVLAWMHRPDGTVLVVVS